MSVVYYKSYVYIHTVGVSVRYNAYYGQGSGPIWLQDVLCKGTEQQLLKCANDYYPIGATRCSHSGDVGVICPS